jgi:hypothetical protein
MNYIVSFIHGAYLWEVFELESWSLRWRRFVGNLCDKVERRWLRSWGIMDREMGKSRGDIEEY